MAENKKPQKGKQEEKKSGVNFTHAVPASVEENSALPQKKVKNIWQVGFCDRRRKRPSGPEPNAIRSRKTADGGRKSVSRKKPGHGGGALSVFVCAIRVRSSIAFRPLSQAAADRRHGGVSPREADTGLILWMVVHIRRDILFFI